MAFRDFPANYFRAAPPRAGFRTQGCLTSELTIVHATPDHFSTPLISQSYVPTVHSTAETEPMNSRQDRAAHSRWISFPFLFPQLWRIAPGISSDPANRAISFHGIAIRAPSPGRSVYAGSARESIATGTGSASLSFPNVFLRCRGSARRNSAVSEWSSRRCSTALALPSQDQRKLAHGASSTMQGFLSVPPPAFPFHQVRLRGPFHRRSPIVACSLEEPSPRFHPRPRGIPRR